MADDGAGTSGSRKRKANLARAGPAAGTRSVQRRQKGCSRASAGRDSQELSAEPLAEQQQLDDLLVRLSEVPFSELPLGATIAHRQNRLVSFRCPSSHCPRCMQLWPLPGTAACSWGHPPVQQHVAGATDWC